MRRWRTSLCLLVFGLACSPLNAFVAPVVPETPCGIARRVRARSPTASRLPGICPHPASGVSIAAAAAAGGGSGDDTAEEKEDGEKMVAVTSDDKSKDGEPADDGGDVSVQRGTKDFGVLSATGASGALLGWSFAHSLGLEVDLVGAVAGCLAALGLLAQEGEVGRVTNKVGQFALGAFEVVGVVAQKSGVPAKVAGTVGEELLEVVQLTSGAVTKGYLDSIPPPNVRLEAEIASSKQTVADLRGQLEKVSTALSEAKAQLAERAENQRVVKAAKTTAAELVDAKAALAEKDAAIRNNLQLARREKDTFDRELKAARAETQRFREMVESKADMDNNFKALTKASDTLEERVREYEGRLKVLTDENDSIRADYKAEIESMENERTTMRDRISGLEEKVAGAETRLNEQREALEKELAVMADALDERAAEAEASSQLAAELKAAVAESVAEKAAAVEKAAAEAAQRAAQEEKARSAQEAKAIKEEAVAAQRAAEAAQKAAEAEKAVIAAEKAAQAEKAAIAAEMQAAEQQRQQRRMAEMARATEAARERELKVRQEVAAREAEIARQKEAAAEQEAAAKKEAEAKQQEVVARQQVQEQERAARAAKEEKRALEQAREKAEAAAAGQETKAAAATAAKKSAPPRQPKAAPAAAGTAGPGARVGEPVSKAGLMKLTVKDLRERCKSAGVPTTGKKADLVDRLMASPVAV